MGETNKVVFITETQNELVYSDGLFMSEHEGDTTLLAIQVSHKGEVAGRTYSPHDEITDKADRNLIAEAAVACDVYVWQVEEEVDELEKLNEEANAS